MRAREAAAAKTRTLGVARKGQLRMTLSMAINLAAPCNITWLGCRLLIKSPLRQRAHSPLSPKLRPLLKFRFLKLAAPFASEY